jgi:hypothetical protein
MAILNLQVNGISFLDQKLSNNPSIRAFDLSFKLLGQQVTSPKSESFSLAPDEVKVIFSGTRTTLIDNTTAFTVTKPFPTENTYRFTNSAGTAPVLRTDRNPSVDNTTQFAVTVNGPLMTLTNTSGTSLVTTSIVIGDILNLGANSGFNPANKGRFTIIAKTSNSITVQNLNATAESATISTASDFMVYSNGGGTSNQIQIGDKVALTGGFSQATQDTYVIVDVTPSYFDVNIASPNGIPLESNIIPTTSGIVFYNASKKFIMVAAQERCSIRLNSDTSDNTVVEPSEVNNPERPGLFIKQGPSYSMSIKNLSLETLNLIVATAE